MINNINPGLVGLGSFYENMIICKKIHSFGIYFIENRIWRKEEWKGGECAR